MKDYILKICAVSLLVFIVSLILPNNKNGKTVKCVLTFLITLVVLEMTSGILDGGIFVSNNGYEDYSQRNFLEYSYEKKKENEVIKITNLLTAKGICGGEISLELNGDAFEGFKINKVIINLKNAVIKSDEKHINIIEGIKKDIASLYGLEKDFITVYE